MPVVRAVSMGVVTFTRRNKVIRHKTPQSLYAMFFSSLNMVIVLLVVQVKNYYTKVFAQNCFRLAIDQHGCCILQQWLGTLRRVHHVVELKDLKHIRDYFLLQTNLTTLRQRPLKPRIIYRVEATIKAPWIARIFHSKLQKQLKCDCFVVNHSTNQQRSKIHIKTGRRDHTSTR
ncbi:hypothetical protein YC2023_040184 [Brassica napus]